MKTIRIAMADDSSLTRYSLNKLIAQTDGYMVCTEASNGQELLDKLNAEPQLPDICVLDIGMPVLDGYATLAAIRKKWPFLKVLMLSIHSAPYSVVHTITAGV